MYHLIELKHHIPALYTYGRYVIDNRPVPRASTILVRFNMYIKRKAQKKCNIYINKAIMEKQSEERSTHSGLLHNSRFNHWSHSTKKLWARGWIEIWCELGLWSHEKIGHAQKDYEGRRKRTRSHALFAICMCFFGQNTLLLARKRGLRLSKLHNIYSGKVGEACQGYIRCLSNQ